MTLAAGLQKARTPTTRLEVLQQLAAELQPPEDLPVGPRTHSRTRSVAVYLQRRYNSVFAPIASQTSACVALCWLSARAFAAASFNAPVQLSNERG